jgi:hypothetical protein
MPAASATCATVGTLLTPPVTYAVTPASGSIVKGAYYVAAATALTTAGVSCTLALGTSTTAVVTSPFTGIATN